MSNFYSMILRMKYINRWALMRNTRTESLSEHSLDVAIIAHALAVLRNKRFKSSCSAERVVLLALFHDCTEIITGDLPTPIKYHDNDIESAFKDIEKIAGNTLLNLLPEDLKGEYDGIFNAKDEDKELWELIKAADKISALIKCIEEEQSGNKEFSRAKTSTLALIKKLNCKEADLFIDEFISAFYLTLDEF